MSPPREIELKLEAPAADLARLARSSLIPAAGKRTSTLVSVYFDTAKLKLRNKGLSLRVRRAGRRHVQTIKQDAEASAALFDRNEWERHIAGAQPDLDAASDTALAPLLSKKLRRNLKPVFETRVRRTVIPIQRGESEIELTIDKGKVKAGSQSSPLCEVELELKRGESAELFKLARALADEVPLQLAVKSKAEQGYALVAGEEPAAVKAGPVALTPDASGEAAFAVIARACLHQLVANRPAMQNGDPEGVHQMRVALRRLRAAISLFSEMLAGPQTDAMKAELKWITGELGPARELDVFVQCVVRPVAEGKPRRAGMAVLSKELRKKREGAFARAQAAIQTTRFRALVLAAAEWIESGDWTRNADALACALRERPIAAMAADELRRRRKKIVQTGARLSQIDPQRRHKLRIRAKKLRYASEFFADAFPGKGAARRHKDFVAALAKLQHTLGDLNDIAVHEALTERIIDEEAAGDRRRRGRAKKAFAAGRLSGREEARAASVLREAEHAYGVFAKAKPFWS
jgi:triphosphatase